MRKGKRGGDDLTRSIHKNRRACKTECVSGHFPVDSTQDVWAGLSAGQKSYLSKSVASIALCKGRTILLSCSGIAMERRYHATRFLTSASLGKELYGGDRDRKELKIEVRHEGNFNRVYEGRIVEYDLDRNFAIVPVRGYLDVQVGPFQRALEILPHGQVLVAVGRSVSGEIMAKSVELNGDLGVYEGDEDLDCNKISKAWEGGPVLFADHVVGMNLFLTTRRAIFKPWDTILKHLEHCWTSQQISKVFRFGARPMGEKSITYPHIVQGYYFKKDLLDLDSMGYPKLPSTMLGTGLTLVNTFEETFGDICGQRAQGVWRKLSKRASNIDRNVVALASFNGFFIKQNECKTILTSASLVRNSDDENKIVENLRDYCARRPLNTVVATDLFKVAVVGRCFESCELMALSGEMVDWTGTLDCSVLKRSTCKITKAGIGGPLINLYGDVVGMNFYDTRIGTPYMAWEDISTVLSWFDTKSKPGEVGHDIHPSGAPFREVVGDETVVLNRWPVPMPHWRHHDFVDEDKSDDEFVSKPRSRCRREYSYMNGVKYMLC